MIKTIIDKEWSETKFKNWNKASYQICQCLSISFYLNHDNKVIAVEGACLAHPIAIWNHSAQWGRVWWQNIWGVIRAKLGHEGGVFCLG